MEKYQFTLISSTPDCIILMSKYHYWRIIQKGTMLFLHHKYNKNDVFHVQRKEPFYSYRAVYKYIQTHDEYFSSNVIRN